MNRAIAAWPQTFRLSPWIFALAIATSSAAYAEAPDIDVVNGLKEYSVAVQGQYEGTVCGTVVQLPAGHTGYAESAKTKSFLITQHDSLIVLLGGQRQLSVYCAPPPSYAPTFDAYIAYLRSGKDASIDKNSLVVRPAKLAGKEASRIDFRVLTPDSPRVRWHRAEVVAFAKLPSGVTVEHLLTMITTENNFKDDELAFETFINNYQRKPDAKN